MRRPDRPPLRLLQYPEALLRLLVLHWTTLDVFSKQRSRKYSQLGCQKGDHYGLSRRVQLSWVFADAHKAYQ